MRGGSRSRLMGTFPPGLSPPKQDAIKSAIRSRTRKRLQAEGEEAPFVCQQEKLGCGASARSR